MERKTEKTPVRIDLVRSRWLLLREKRRLLEAVHGAERETAGLEEARDDPEIEENALRSHALAVISRLEDSELHRLEEIDHALAKIASGEYGRCERCHEPIEKERLEALPATRYCARDAREVERELAAAAAQTPEPDSQDPPLPADFANLSPAEIVAIVREELDAEDDLRGVRVEWRDGEIVLAGEVPSEELGEIARQIVADRLGLPVDDRTRPTPVLRELPDGKPLPPEEDTEADPVEQLLGGDVLIEDPMEADEKGEPLTPPDTPIPEPRKG
jgi:DnaK suppressor protein